MSSEIDTLAEEYWQHYLETNPTSAHLLGEYDRAAEFDEATRESEDRDISALRSFARARSGDRRERARRAAADHPSPCSPPTRPARPT